MAATRYLFVIVGTSFLMACLATEVAAPAATQVAPVQQAQAAAKVFQGELWTIINTPHYQCVIALLSFITGVVALWDGKRFFKFLVSFLMGAVAFTVVMSQLRPTWTGPVAHLAKYVAAIEAGLFIGFAAFVGWEGTQLLLGLSFGLYLFHVTEATALTISFLQIDLAAEHSVFIITVCTLLVGFATWALHDRYGAGRVLGGLVPLFGGSLVVATFGYLFMLACTNIQSLGEAVHCTPEVCRIPSVFEVWSMICVPGSQAVGYFTFRNMNPVVGGVKLPVDRMIGWAFWLLFSAVSIYHQQKADFIKRTMGKGNALNDRLLAKAPPSTESLPNNSQSA